MKNSKKVLKAFDQVIKDLKEMSREDFLKKLDGVDGVNADLLISGNFFAPSTPESDENFTLMGFPDGVDEETFCLDIDLGVHWEFSQEGSADFNITTTSGITHKEPDFGSSMYSSSRLTVSFGNEDGQRLEHAADSYEAGEFSWAMKAA